MKVNDIEPSLGQWRELYAAAEEFKKIECWNWLYDSDLFGVRDPQTGGIAYCSVLGNAGELFALTVYPGDEALESYWRIAEGAVTANDLEALVAREGLEASFGPRKFLEKRDLTVIKQLGLQFRGATGWPCFRSHRRGYAPWFLSGEEARLLTFALRQAREIALWAKDEPEKLAHETDDEAILVRELAGGQWRDVWVKPQRGFAEAPPQPPPVEAARLEALRALNCQCPEAWEVEIFPLPFPISEKAERPYYSYTMLAVMRSSGFVLCSHLADPPQRAAAFQEHFFKMTQSTKLLPQEVYVANQETYDFFKPLGDGLGFRVNLVKRLPALEEARDSMFAMMQGGFPM
jgi:hypothetical protein